MRINFSKKATRFIVINPKLAAEFLARNTRNRPMSKGHHQGLEAAIRGNHFILNGDTIRFDRNGDLIDGQHRLQAIVDSNKSVECILVTGLPPEAFTTIPQSKSRSTGDSLGVMGYSNRNVLAGALRWVKILTSKDVDGHNRCKGALPGVCGYEIPQLLKDNPSLQDSVSEALGVLRQVGKSRQIVPGAKMAALYYLFGLRHPRKNKLFWDRLVVGEGLTRTMPEFWLRKQLLDNLASHSKLTQTAMMALVIKTWNAVMKGKEMKSLRWGIDEAFPRIEGEPNRLKTVG